MLEEIKKILRDCLTENDGKSYCLFRVVGGSMCFSGIPTFIGATIYSVIHRGVFDAVQFATGFGAMMTGLAILCGGVALKAKTDKPSNE